MGVTPPDKAHYEHTAIHVVQFVTKYVLCEYCYQHRCSHIAFPLFSLVSPECLSRKNSTTAQMTLKVCVCMCVCVGVWVCVEEEERRREGSDCVCVFMALHVCWKEG